MSSVEYFASQVKLFDYKTKHVSTEQVTSQATVLGLVPDNVWATGAPALWKLTFDGSGCIVGVIDTGIDDGHPDLKNKIILRRDYIQDGSSPTNFNSHGTHVGGTIAANGAIKGVAPGVSLIDYRVLDRNGSGSYQSITSAIKQSITDGCNIISLSLGGPSYYAPLHTAIKEATQAGVLVVVASGNDGPNRVSYPANHEEVVSVGAVNFDSATGNITLPQTPWFSNSNIQVDVAADGWNVLSTVPGGKYAILTGTSMATPCVAGFAALLWHKFKVKMGRKPTEQELYSSLKSHTVDILAVGNDIVAGTGFVTFYPELPKKTNGLWSLPTMNATPPYVTSSATSVNTMAMASERGVEVVRVQVVEVDNSSESCSCSEDVEVLVCTIEKTEEPEKPDQPETQPTVIETSTEENPETKVE